MANDIEYDYSSHDNQTILNCGIEEEIKTAYIDYAMSVIIGRALPDARDGLKPVHRRILYSMYEDRLTYDKAFRKSATTVGNVLGRYHPHGDAAVYDAMVRLVQSFSMRYPLVEGQGNFGNIDGDGAAAYRYTEARMAKMANLMLEDIDKDVVNFIPNFDNRLQEPEYLPSRFPNLLVNGSIGIAVGMATNIPPHNLCEANDAVCYLLDNPECTIDDLMKIIKGPDFPTYGTIYGTAGITEMYKTGRGRMKVRAEAHFEENKNRTSIIITELPYQVNRSMLLETMADLVKSKRIEGISDIRNESGKKGMRIVIDVKREANAQVILNNLYKNTQLEDTFAANMLALVDGEPKTLNLKQILECYVTHQKSVITRRTRFELDKARKSAHIYEGYRMAIDNIDRVIAIIRSSPNVSEAKVRLTQEKFSVSGESQMSTLLRIDTFEGDGTYFSLSDEQAQAIVDMTLGRLSGMERQKIDEMLAAFYAQIDDLTAILADENKITEIIKTDLGDIKSKFGDARRTRIVQVENEILTEDLIERVHCIVTATHEGYIKRIPSETYRAQRRGGRGVTAMSTKEEDTVEDVISCESHDYMLMFTNIGRVYSKKCYEIPESSRTAKGTNLVNVLSLNDGEKVTAIVPISEFTSDEYLMMITKNGVVKRINLIEYKTNRTGGLYAINLDEGDSLLYVLKTKGNGQVIIASHNGMCVRFDEQIVRATGRQSRGVRAMNLSDDDFIIGAAAIPENYSETDLKVIVVTENGYGKRTDIDEFMLHNRGGKGKRCHKITEKTGKLAGINVVGDNDEIMMITNEGIIIRTNVSGISVVGCNTSGVILMRMTDGATISRFTVIKNDLEETEETEETETDNESAEIGEENVRENKEESEETT